jgi:spore maturation protein CgeB
VKIAFFASSLVSAYWNGAATYYRGIVRALAARGHVIDFYEPDAFDRQRHRDMPDPYYARVVVWEPSEEGALRALEQARGADVVVKASGVGVLDAFLEEQALRLQGPATKVVFWDVDAPATLERVAGDARDPFLPLVSRYDLVLTYGGGSPVVRAYEALGARRCVPIYNALDPDTHHRAAPEERFVCDLALMANRLPDREERIHEFFFKPARMMPHRRFLLGGNGWDQRDAPPNVTCLGHMYTREHNAFNSTPLAVLNVSRASMARFGHSPATRVFEAAGAGACLITDAWEGQGAFFEPDTEWLVARNGDEVRDLLATLTPGRARAIGEAARLRVLAHHTYDRRAALVEELLQ